jgi:tetratricopeptide (TPR) repeat protein
MMKTSYVCSFVFALLLFMQNERVGEVKGEILDMRGKPISGALVVYTNTLNQKHYSVKTDATGRFLIIGLMLGDYDVKITGPAGQQVYSGRKSVYGIDKQALNVIQIDLSLVPTKASLAPFLGAKAGELQREPWRNVTESTLRDLTPEQRAELRKENALIADYNALTPQAQKAIKAQDWTQAAALLEQLLKIAPYKWELYQNLGSIQRRLTRFKDAVQTLEKGINILNDDPEQELVDNDKVKVATVQMSIEEGEAYIAMGNLEAAASKFRTAVQLDPGSELAYLHLCTAEYNTGHADEAIAACERAIALEPRHSENYQVMAGVQSNLERYQDALATYQKGIAVAQDNVTATRPSRNSNINSRKFSDPSPAIAESVRAGQMLQSVGNIYFQLKNYPKAVEFFTQSARLHPYPALPLFNLCATLYDMDNLPAAAAACNRSTEADPKMPDPYFVKASALYGESARHGKSRGSHETRSALEKYLQLAPEGSYAGEARAMLKEISAR